MLNERFETHQAGTAEELALCRSLARSIEQVLFQYGNVVPQSVLVNYEKLKSFYERNNLLV
jgi:hypothetical protein